MECLRNYQIVKNITKYVYLVKQNQQQFIAKGVSEDELQTSILMDKGNVGPHIKEYQYCNDNIIMIMEKFDGNLTQLWPFIGTNARDKVISIINRLIIKMHELDFSHSDLHARNIAYKEDEQWVEFAIIDFDSGYKISASKEDGDIIEWIKGLGWEGTSEEFIKFAFQTWKRELERIPLPTDYIFDNYDKKYLEGDCGLLAIALNKRLGWDIYGIFQKDLVPAHYLLRAPGGQFFLDITGLRKKSDLEHYWYNYFVEEGYNNVKVIFHKVDNILCNSDYYRDIKNDIDNEEVNRTADIIVDKIKTKYRLYD